MMTILTPFTIFDLIAGFSFAYVCKYSNNIITETIAYRSDSDKSLYVCESCAVYTAKEIAELSGRQLLTNEKAAIPLLAELKARKLYQTYLDCIDVSVAPLHNHPEREKVMAAYSKLTDAGYRFVGGELERTKFAIKFNLNAKLESTRMDLQVAWDSRNEVHDYLNGEYVVTEEKESHKRLANASSFVNSIDPKSMIFLKELLRLPENGHHSLSSIAKKILNNPNKDIGFFIKIRD